MFSLKKLLSNSSRIYVATDLSEALERIRRAPKVKSKDYGYATYLVAKRNQRYRLTSQQRSDHGTNEIECYIPLYDIASKQWREDYPKWRYVFKVKKDNQGAYIDTSDVSLHDSYRYFDHLTQFEIQTFKDIIKKELNLN